LCADGEDRTGAGVLRDDRRLADDDPPPAHVYQGVCGPKVHADVPADHAEERIEQLVIPSAAHRDPRRTTTPERSSWRGLRAGKMTGAAVGTGYDLARVTVLARAEA